MRDESARADYEATQGVDIVVGARVDYEATLGEGASDFMGVNDFMGEGAGYEAAPLEPFQQSHT